jgi:hypothetical protein
MARDPLALMVAICAATTDAAAQTAAIIALKVLDGLNAD